LEHLLDLLVVFGAALSSSVVLLRHFYCELASLSIRVVYSDGLRLSDCCCVGDDSENVVWRFSLAIDGNPPVSVDVGVSEMG
jgi:hypothetical protein